MNSSPTSGPARQLARRRGQARMSALTRGIGAASIVGAVAIAIALPQSTGASTVKTASAATTSVTSKASGDDNNASDDSSSAGTSASQIQSTPAPATTTNPPAATSGGS
jgi:hypothetical protein